MTANAINETKLKSLKITASGELIGRELEKKSVSEPERTLFADRTPGTVSGVGGCSHASAKSSWNQRPPHFLP